MSYSRMIVTTCVLFLTLVGNAAPDTPRVLTNGTLLPRQPRSAGAPASALRWDIPDQGAPRTATPFIVESDAFYTVAYGDQYYGAVAAGPGEYFAVWVDLRVGGANPAGYDLYAQRILPDGTVGAPGSLVLLRDDARMTSGIPAVAWNGQVYLVAWYEGSTLWGMRVTPDGTPLDPGGFVIGQRTNSFYWPAIASDGADFLVVDVAGGHVLGARVAGDGSVLDPQPLQIMPGGASGLGYPKVTFGAGEYLTVWAQAPDQSIRGCRVLANGTLLDAGGFNISGAPAAVVDAHTDFDGSDFFVVWFRQNGSVYDLWGTHVSPGAAPSSPNFITGGAQLPGGISGGQVAFNGTNHLVALTSGEPVYSNTDLHAQLIDFNGDPIGGPFPVSTIEGRSQTGYGAASIGSQFFIVWEGNRLPGVYYIYDTEGARVTGDGQVLDRPEPIDVSPSAAWQINSCTSFDGTNFLCVFEDWREGPDFYQPDLYAVRVTASGQPVDATAFQVAGGFESPQQNPDATFGGGQHVIVYENAANVNEVRMVRVLPDATVLDPSGVLVFANEPTAETLRPKVAWNGQKYFVIWYDNYLFSGQKPLQFALMRTDGTKELGPVNIPNSDAAGFDGFEVAAGGSEFLVAWTAFDRIQATRISNAGAVIGTQTVQITGNWIIESTHAGFNGESYLVAWSQWGDAGVSIYARRLSSTGVPVGTTFMVAGPAFSAVPLEILIAGTDFDVIGSTTDSASGTTTIFQQRIDAAGNLVGGPQTIFAGPRWSYYGSSSFALGLCGQALAAMSLWADNPYNAPRTQGLMFAAGAGCPGDLNCDGAVDFGDINPFVLTLTDPAGYALAFPNCDIMLADINGDGSVGFGDINPFVALLTGMP
jgi:hypothetical protein